MRHAFLIAYKKIEATFSWTFPFSHKQQDDFKMSQEQGNLDVEETRNSKSKKEFITSLRRIYNQAVTYVKRGDTLGDIQSWVGRESESMLFACTNTHKSMIKLLIYPL
jgi:hypothetical protein